MPHATPQHLLKDASLGLMQQMIIWGHDVRHPSGNLLSHFGMQKRASPNHKGSSCYSMEWEKGIIELHGTAASWSPPPSPDESLEPKPIGTVFTRPTGKIQLWSETNPPIPGQDFGYHSLPEIRWNALKPLIRWIITYEHWIFKHYGNAWRSQCWLALKAISKAKPWLPPILALNWWEIATSENPTRAKLLIKP
jgi:hypothetical protein